MYVRVWDKMALIWHNFKHELFDIQSKQTQLLLHVFLKHLI